MTERDCISVLREHGFKENIQGALYRFINWLSAQYGKAYIKVFKDEVEGK